MPPDVAEITKPERKRDDYFLGANNKTLVASGEQGYLYLMLKGFLPKGKYVTITPCFRNESQGLLHRKQFIKCELIDVDSNSDESLQSILRDATSFMRKYLQVEIIPTEGEKLASASYDLRYEGVELGSYGIRQFGSMRWIYGTGIAEPRFSEICAHKKERSAIPNEGITPLPGKELPQGILR